MFDGGLVLTNSVTEKESKSKVLFLTQIIWSDMRLQLYTLSCLPAGRTSPQNQNPVVWVHNSRLALIIRRTYMCCIRDLRLDEGGWRKH